MPFPVFDRNRLIVKPLSQRCHDLDLSVMKSTPFDYPEFENSALEPISETMFKAYRQRTESNSRTDPATILIMGAHVIRSGVSPLIIEWMKSGLITHVAMNGAGPIHDWEFARIGKTTESVARYINSGEFGLWHETGLMNDSIRDGAANGVGMGECLGRTILDNPEDFPYQSTSILAESIRSDIPVTSHIGIGYDIIHEHPNADGAALGATSYQDFLVFTQSVSQLEHGVLLNFGSAVMGPEVYLKALAMSRNVAHQNEKTISDFMTAVFDIVPLPEDTRTETGRSNPLYYFRPWKTILARTVADGGTSHYVEGRHDETLPALYLKLMQRLSSD